MGNGSVCVCMHVLEHECMTTHQPIQLCDADLIRVHHAEVPPGDQIQTQLPVTHKNTHFDSTHQIPSHHGYYNLAFSDLQQHIKIQICW